MSGKLLSVEVLVADLTLDHDLGALSLDVLEKLLSGHVLVLLLVADVTTKFGAVVHRVLLQLIHRLPDDEVLSVPPAPVGELAEVDAVLHDFVNFLHEVTSCLAVGAADIKARSRRDSAIYLLSGVHGGGVSLPLPWRHSVQLVV